MINKKSVTDQITEEEFQEGVFPWNDMNKFSEEYTYCK